MTDPSDETICLVATEWWKSAHRLIRLVQECAANRAQREIAQAKYSAGVIEEALSRHGLRMVDHHGQPFGPHLPAEPVNPEDFEGEDNVIVAHTLEPTIMRGTDVVTRGKVVLAREESTRPEDA